MYRISVHLFGRIPDIWIHYLVLLLFIRFLVRLYSSCFCHWTVHRQLTAGDRFSLSIDSFHLRNKIQICPIGKMTRSFVQQLYLSLDCPQTADSWRQILPQYWQLSSIKDKIHICLIGEIQKLLVCCLYNSCICYWTTGLQTAERWRQLSPIKTKYISVLLIRYRSRLSAVCTAWL